MRRKFISLLLLAVGVLVLLACSLGDLVQPTPKSESASVDAVVYLSTLSQMVDEGKEIRADFRKAMDGTIGKKITVSKFLEATEKARDWHLEAVKRMERAGDKAPAEYKKSARLYCDFLRSFADSLDLMARGIKEDNTSLFNLGAEKMEKAAEANDAFTAEMEKILKEKKKK